MARIRTVKPEFFRHEELQQMEIDMPGQYPMMVFSALWGHCDKNGVFEWKPRQLQLDIIPFIWEATGKHLRSTLEALVKQKFIKTYTDGQKVYGFIPTFKEHQRINGKEAQAPAQFPEIEQMQVFTISEATEKHLRSNREAPEKQPRSNRDDRKGREGKGRGREEEGIKTSSVSQAKADPVPYDSIIESANQILGKKFRATDKHKSIIRARWNEGFREDDFSKVCSTMLVVWGSDPKMQAYLRPETLFGTKMDGYLNTAPVESRELSRSEQWRKEAQSEVNAFVYGGRNDQDNRQHTGQAALC